MSLRVLSVAYPLAKVGCDCVGGAEQVLSMLDAALVEAGHESVVVACQGSDVAGSLVVTPRVSGELSSEARRAAQQRHREAIATALRRWRFDLVHMHGVDFYEYLPRDARVPVVATLHLPPSWYPPEVLRGARPGVFLNCVSLSQRRSCPGPVGDGMLGVIENGVDCAGPWRATRGDGAYAMAMGRICPEKGFHLAMDAAKRAGVSLALAGEVFGYAEHVAYFEREIRPRVDRRRRFIGSLGRERKRRLLARAHCLLAPSLVEETSSLVAMEAMACGTPVVAFARGALAEIVEDGVTGFLVGNEREMADAIGAAGRLERRRCREAARERFSRERMTGSYLRMYERLVRGEPVCGGVR